MKLRLAEHADGEANALFDRRYSHGGGGGGGDDGDLMGSGGGGGGGGGGPHANKLLELAATDLGAACRAQREASYLCGFFCSAIGDSVPGRAVREALPVVCGPF
jgi:hypothetical protein